VVNVQRAFLNGRFRDGEQFHFKIPEEFKDKYNNDSVLKLNLTIYEVKQAPTAFWNEFLKFTLGYDLH
jgi:hypothetical protein